MTGPFFSSMHSSAIADTPLQDVIRSYIDYFASGSSHTARAKQIDLHHFSTFLARAKKVTSLEKLKVKDWDYSSVQRFIEDCLKSGEAPTTVSRRLATLKHMGRTLAEKVAGFVNPAKEVKAPKIPPTKPKGLTREEIEEVREFAHKRVKSRDSFVRKRNTTLFNFLLDTGLRADEIRLLKLSQIDDELSWIRDVRTKGRRFRNVYITTAMRRELQDYLKLREKALVKLMPALTKSQNSNLPLFISLYDAVPGKVDTFYMGSKTVWRAVRELSQGTKLHPHLLRHSFAIDLLNQSNDIRLVAQALGHSDVRVTMRYTERRDEEVAEALENSRKKTKRS